MSGLHSGEIECLARRMLCNVTPNDSTKWYSLSPIRWLGVFARDELPDLRHMQRPFALVVNTDPHDKPGQHWLAIYGPSDKPLKFFDSFGMLPSNYGFYTSFGYSCISLHSFSSALCGNYTIYFIFYRSRSVSFNKIISFLKSCSNSNLHVKTYVLSLQKAYRTINPCLRRGHSCTFKCSFC